VVTVGKQRLGVLSLGNPGPMHRWSAELRTGYRL